MADQPNIVLFVTDSQGWNALGECGEGVANTPNIDALAEEGVRFDNTYATAVPCTPSRAGLFSGQYCHASGAWTNNLRLYKGVKTMGHHLRREGYRTAYIGKWHLDGDYFGTGEAAPGYDPEFWYDGKDYREDIGEDLWEWYRSGMDTRVAENDIDEIYERDITREDTWAGNITNRVLDFLDAVDDEPFFLVVSYDEPHEPSLCPPPYCDMYRDEEYPLPDNYESVADLKANDKTERQRELAERYTRGDVLINSLEHAEEEGGLYRPLYFGCSTFVDDEIGRVVDAVDKRFPETVITFTSDHGHYLGAHGIDLKHFPMYDEVTRVPLIVRGPGFAEGAVSTSLTSLIDLLPTYLDVAGADPPADLHGQSFLPTSRDPDRPHRDHALVEYHSYGGGDFYPVRCLVSDDGYKLVVNLLDTDELYDLDESPREVTNRIADDGLSERRDALHDQLLETMAETNDAFHGDDWADRPWQSAGG
ncbi:sulfatase-like hydrolase/transferase [Halomontanus rarus]|uniref:sulfatase-like hydrolase/transferase n=1 Tax=Halomontanus rarus TaxID=3034020 RepID=UPI0023E8A5E4|nr:sulfatase-like hydrolase/transferase [Halovivax sp. TS33]